MSQIPAHDVITLPFPSCQKGAVVDRLCDAPGHWLPSSRERPPVESTAGKAAAPVAYRMTGTGSGLIDGLAITLIDDRGLHAGVCINARDERDLFMLVIAS